MQEETSNAVDVVEEGSRRTQDRATVVERTHEAFLNIDKAIEDINARIEQIAFSSQQIAATAHELAGNARAPSDLVAQFKLAK